MRPKGFELNLAVVLTLGLLILSLLHVYFVAGFDTRTSLAVLAVIEPVRALQAAFLTFLPAAVTGYILAYTPRYVLVRRRSWWTYPRVLLAAMLVVLTLPFIASASPVGIVVLSTCGVIVGLAERRELATTGALRGPVEATARLPLLAFAIVGSLFMVLTQHWTPQEELVLEGGKAAVGRVMGSQGGQILLLGEANEAIWVKEANIRNRRLCGSATQPWILRPLTELLAPQSRYDPC